MAYKKKENNDRRDVETNGLGRRHYDVMSCPFFDRKKIECREIEKVKKEIMRIEKDKLSSWIFRSFVGTMLLILGIFVTLGWNAFNAVMTKSDTVNENVKIVQQSVVALKANQKILMEDLGVRRFHDDKR
jgi:hypothetical protein